MLNKTIKKILDIINSRGFFRFVIIFFVLEAAWIALTAVYPQAFDEQFHFGLIKLYSHHLSPFLSQQPTNADQFGAVARSPSYLYHYLMSFPYRLIEIIFKNQVYQIITLRFIDIAMFTYGLVLFKKILIKAKVSNALANASLFIFTLIPIVPQLAGQINYDDMFIPLTAIVCLLSFRLIEEIKQHKISFLTLSLLIITATFNSLVKFAFLPIYLAIVCFFSYYLFYKYRNNLSIIWQSFKDDFKRRSIVIKTILIGIILLAIFMFIQRDIVNIIKYHSVDPSCSSVLSIKSCKAYSAWYANFRRHNALINGHTNNLTNIIVYAGEWLYWMWYRLFFAINGPASKFTNYPPLPLPSAIALVLGAIGLFAVIKYRRQVFKTNIVAKFLLTISLFYLIALFIQGYATYRYTAVLENMNGRYLLPILLLVGALVVKALAVAFKKYNRTRVILACIVILMFLQGGGILTYIIRSDDTWYWQNTKIIKLNHAAKKLTKHIIVRGKSGYRTKIWFFN